MCENPTLMACHAFTTSTIARSVFERLLPHSLVIYRKLGDIGCNAAAFPGGKIGKPIADEHVHEHSTCFNLKGRKPL